MIDKNTQEKLMRIVLDEVDIAIKEGNSPFAAILIDNSGNLICKSHNTAKTKCNPVLHAEINLISDACKILNTRDLSDYCLVSNAWSCSMCMSASIKAKIKNFIFGASSENDMNPNITVFDIKKKTNYDINIITGVLEEECKDQIQRARKMEYNKEVDEENKDMFISNSLGISEKKTSKVLLGMSGGVDSSVSAVLLKENGYEVIGTTMELFTGSSCCNTNTYLDAKNVCNQLEIPHFIFNFKKEFREYVINDFINCYSNCKTPNPCIECNKYMKFGLMYQKAKELGCEYIATGHYAKTEYSEKYNRWVLKKSKAGKKDQSYVLWNMPKELIEHIIFPLSDFESKDEIREIAKTKNLKVANKPDSEDICFVPDGNYKKFLENNSNIKPMEGNIVNKDGKVLGKHTGLYNYTIGQRRGLGISNSVPLFVLGFNKENNEVIVGEEKELYKKEILVSDINLLLIDEINNWLEVDVKTRYSSKIAKAKIKQENKIIKVIFDEPQRAITPGQSAVFYIDDIVLGGGKIL